MRRPLSRALGLLALGLPAGVLVGVARAEEPRSQLLERTVPAEGLELATYRCNKTRLDYRDLSSAVRSSSESIELTAMFVDPARYQVRLIVGTDAAQRATVRELCASAGAVAGVNGGFFDEKDRLLGLHVVQGRELAPFGMRGKRTAGVFCCNGGRYQILRNAAYERLRGEAGPGFVVDEALQSFPVLVAFGLPVYRSTSRMASRSAVGLTRDGRVALVTSESDPFNGLSLADLASFMARSLGCRHALNLDGGGSSQLWFDAGGVVRSVAGRDRVRSALGVFPRGK